MKPSLQLKISQQLTMTPQLQQAIRLLQLSTLDLQQEIQQALDSNPMLEMEEEGEQDSNHDQHNESNDNNSDADERADNASTETNQDHKGADDDSGFDSDSFTKDNLDNNSFEAESSFDPDDPVADSDWNEQIPVELSTDSTWDDTYQNAPSSTPSSASGGDDQGDYESTDHAAETLHDHLLWQLNLTPMSELDRLIAMNIIDGIDEDGYLRTDLQDILESFLDDHAEELPTALNGVDVSTASSPPAAADADLDNGQEGVVELDEIEAVLHRIQQFDPPGVACRDLRECLLTQLNQLPETTPALSDARLVIDKHLALLGSHDYKQLMRRCRLKEPQLKAAVELIQQLNPRPGNQIEYNEVEYVIPDVIVKKEEGVWRIQLNPDSAPRIRINDHYASMVKRADTSADNTYLRNHLQEARWFLKSLHSRNDTLLRVSSKIVEHQQDFLEYGEEAMKPLILHDIAEAVEMHESTISRVTTQKYMHTPRGIFELKYFFSSHVGTATGGECSSTAIRAIIKKLVAAENVAKPLSDSKIANLLDEQGINVARRTIAKYREAMNIPPSNERKRLV